MQMELIEPTEQELLREELTKTKEQLNNLRRGLFGRYDKMVNELSTLQEDVLKIRQKFDMKDEERTDREVLEFPLQVSSGI